MKIQSPRSPGVLLPTNGLWPQFLGRALAALRSIGMTNESRMKLIWAATSPHAPIRLGFPILLAGVLNMPVCCARRSQAIARYAACSSEQAGATNGAVYRARKGYNGKFSVNFSAVKTCWVEF